MTDPPARPSTFRTAPRGRSWPRRAGTIVRHAVVFAASGPAIGAFTSLAGILLRRFEWPGFGPVLGRIIAAYVLFAVSADAAGACVAVAANSVSTP